MDNLRFVLTHKDDERAAGEAWGVLAIFINDELLLKTEWNLAELIEWYLETRGRWFSTSLPDVRPDESLAQALRRLSDALREETADGKADKLHQLQYEFRREHSLKFTFRGSYIPDAIIGINPDVIIGVNQGQGEISVRSSDTETDRLFRERGWIKSGSWSYSFDVTDFETYMEQHLKQYLSEWLTRTNNSLAITKAQHLLAQF